MTVVLEHANSPLDWLPRDETPPREAALAYRAHGFRPIPIYAPSARR